jgi:hypothetical protein
VDFVFDRCGGVLALFIVEFSSGRRVARLIDGDGDGDGDGRKSHSL